jgi:hypothetical protein
MFLRFDLLLRFIVVFGSGWDYYCVVLLLRKTMFWSRAIILFYSVFLLFLIQGIVFLSSVPLSFKLLVCA